MRKFIGTALILTMLLTGGATAFGAQVSLGIRIGAPPPRVVRVTPLRPGRDYIWVDGYWYPVGGHYRWHAGYWTLPSYPGAHWVAPRHDGHLYFRGYWDGDRGRLEHDFRWDHERARDGNRFHDDHHDDHH